MLSSDIVSPLYSITVPVPPAVPICRIIESMISFAVTACRFFLLPSTLISKVVGFSIQIHWVAKTCSTSLVPIPNANAPKAPCVEVWLSPQTIVAPGNVIPSSGPITCTIPWLGLCISNNSIPKSLQFFSNTWICLEEIWSTIGNDLSVVGTLWSIVANVRSVLRTTRLFILNPSKACGDVTSWTRCLST